MPNGRRAVAGAAGSVPADFLEADIAPGRSGRGPAVPGRGVQQQVEQPMSRSREGGGPRDLPGLLAAARDSDGSALTEPEIRGRG